MIVVEEIARDEDGRLPPIEDDEVIARFILASRHLRGDATIRPEAFIPHPHEELSAYRICHLSEEAIWNGGRGVALYQGKRLYGRAEVVAVRIRAQALTVTADELPTNHITIAGWPKEKSEQKLIAIEIAKSSRTVLFAD